MASAQVKSCVLWAGLYAEGTTRVTEPAPTRHHTERMLSGLGYPVKRSGATAELTGNGTITACNIDGPAENSSAKSCRVAACIAPGADIPRTRGAINLAR